MSKKERKGESILESFIFGWIFLIPHLIDSFSSLFFKCELFTKKHYFEWWRSRIEFLFSGKDYIIPFFFLQRNFVESMAGYSLVCYLLQVLFSLSLTHTHTHTPHISRMLAWELFRVAFSNWNDVSWIRILMLEVLCRSLLHCELVMLENLFINRFFIKNKIEGIRRAYNTVCDSCHLCFVYV